MSTEVAEVAIDAKAAADAAASLFSGRFTPGATPAPEPPKQEEQPPANTEAPKGEEAPKEIKEEEKSAETHPLLRMMRGESEEKEVAEIEVPKEVVEFFTKAGLGDAKEHLKLFPTLKAEAEKNQAALKEVQDQIAILENLSDEVKSIIALDLDGKDWRAEVASKPKLDWRLTFEKQDKKTILDTYAKGKVSDEEWENYTGEYPDPTTKKFVDAVIEGAKFSYDNDRNGITGTHERIRKEKEAEVQKRNVSLEKGLQHAYSTVPGSEAYKDEIIDALNNIGDMIYEKDGVSFKHDAPLKAWMLKNADAFFGSREKRIREEARDGALLKTLRRADEKQAVDLRSENPANNRDFDPNEEARALFHNRLNSLRK